MTAPKRAAWRLVLMRSGGDCHATNVLARAWSSIRSHRTRRRWARVDESHRPHGGKNARVYDPGQSHCCIRRYGCRNARRPDLLCATTFCKAQVDQDDSVHRDLGVDHLAWSEPAVAATKVDVHGAGPRLSDHHRCNGAPSTDRECELGSPR